MRRATLQDLVTKSKQLTRDRKDFASRMTFVKKPEVPKETLNDMVKYMNECAAATVYRY